MTIKTKLICNVLFTAAIIGTISLASYFSLSFLQQKLSYLTEKSTPFQMRTTELQRELQGCISTLVKVNAARNMTEYKTLQAEAEKSLVSVDNARKSLETIRSSSSDISGELDKIALELFFAVEERISRNDAATTANADVLKRMQESSARLDDLETYISNLQVNYSRAYAEALEKTRVFTGRLRSIEELRNFVRELQLIVVNVQNTQNGSTVLIAKGKLRSVAVRIAKNEYYISNSSIAAVTNGFTEKLANYIKLQSVALSHTDEESKNKAAAAGKDLLYKLNDLFQTLDQDTMLARDELSLAYGRQGNLFTQSNNVNDILVANSKLVAMGLRVTGETNRLFTLDSRAELSRLDSEIRALFTKIQERVQMLETSLTKLHALEELKILRAAGVSLAAIRTTIYADNGIITTLHKKLSAIEQANRSSDKLYDLVFLQTAKGKESVSVAQGEQDKSIASVNRMVRRSLSQIFSIGIMAILIGTFFGFWLFRSVLLPLRLVLAAVTAQQEQIKEKACLAEAVAGGDLDREVTVIDAIRIDPEGVKKDEMGMVLAAVIGMSEAQVVFSRAFAGMTAGLRSNRDEEIRRDRLKNGLYDLNKILRDDQNISGLADRALAFMAGFLGAGVGIIYRYDETKEMLRILSTYAISRSYRLSEEGIRLGEGLSGQVAAERKMICIHAVPPDYLPISSALGEANPLSLVIVPIMHNDSLLGVLELGSFRQFGDDDFTFLNQALEGIAIAMKVNRSRQLVDELLEQTQAQTEELHVQQEELRQSNEELTERARLVKLKYDSQSRHDYEA
jgi:putative methionine-R-sulfoxide reductase with GAF domain